MTKPKHFRVDHLPIRALTLDSRYQRAVIQSRVKKLVQEWRDSDIGAITVSVRDPAEAKAYVIDGQHRVRAAMELGLGDMKVLCHVYTGLTLDQEARKFLALNDSRAVTPVDSYRAGLVAGDPTCVGVDEILSRYNLRVQQGGDGDSTLRCITRAVALYRRDPKVLEDTIRVISTAWGMRSAGFEQVVFAAIGAVLGQYNGELDRASLTKKLSNYRGGPAALVGDARGLADYKGGSISRAAAEIIVTTYNRGRRSGQLAPL